MYGHVCVCVCVYELMVVSAKTRGRECEWVLKKIIVILCFFFFFFFFAGK